MIAAAADQTFSHSFLVCVCVYTGPDAILCRCDGCPLLPTPLTPEAAQGGNQATPADGQQTLLEDENDEFCFICGLGVCFEASNFISILLLSIFLSKKKNKNKK